jgi:hypothetical protein
MPELRPAKRMAQVVEGLARDFAREHGLTHLGPYDLFETFTAYCIVKRYHREFDPDDLRAGGSRAGGPHDQGVDAYAVIINGRLFTEPHDVEEFVEQHRQLEVRFIVVLGRQAYHLVSDADRYDRVAGNPLVRVDLLDLQGQRSGSAMVKA